MVHEDSTERFMKLYFVFDVESIGLHGEGFAVGGGVYLEDGSALSEFRFACPVDSAFGDNDGRRWVKENCPVFEITHRNPRLMRDAFWEAWAEAHMRGAVMAADCPWPVEARFVAQCVTEEINEREGLGPYPFIDIGSVLLAKGKDPLGVFERTTSELPKHDPLADARQSARILCENL